MVRLTEIYMTAKINRILPNNIKEFKNGLTINKVEVIGKKRKGILLSFKETDLQHKCNRIDAFALADKLKTDEIEKFVGHKVNFTSEEDFVRLKV